MNGILKKLRHRINNPPYEPDPLGIVVSVAIGILIAIIVLELERG